MQSLSNSKRPTCPICSRPLSLCFCSRFKTSNLDNKVHITILQHSLEKKHPLNSARIAKIGLKNVDIFTVSDVLIDAQFVIGSLGSDIELGLNVGECTSGVCENDSESLVSGGYVEGGKHLKRGFDSSVSVQCCDDLLKDVSGGLVDEEDYVIEQCKEDVVLEDKLDGNVTKVGKKCNVEPVISVVVGKYGKISSFYHSWKMQDEGKTVEFDQFIASPEGVRFLEKGFVVKKLQNQQKGGSIGLEQVEEFKIKVPSGSVLLFPAQKSVPVEAIDFEVKNLIVLDGTWAKANRMYKENPWLRLLPCVKLDVEKLSLFSEVRRQPKPGYLSTIESIVYALEALGEKDNVEGLNGLLNVLESIVEDQRRCKDECMRKLSSA